MNIPITIIGVLLICLLALLPCGKHKVFGKTHWQRDPGYESGRGGKHNGDCSLEGEGYSKEATRPPYTKEELKELWRGFDEYFERE